MRKLYRSIARARMERAGMKHINRPTIHLTAAGIARGPSYFSRNWRNWCLTDAPMTGRRV